MAEEKIKTRVKGLLRDPIVNVKLLNFNFTILGEVNRPGEYRTLESSITFFEAVGFAGDMTDFADRANIRIVRYNESKAQITYVNVLDANFIHSGFFYLKPNDLILVSPSKIKNFKRYQLANFGIVLSALTAISLLLIRTR